MSIPTAAWTLSVGRTTIYALMRTGELRSVRIGRLRRVPAEAPREYVQALGGVDAVNTAD